MRQAYYNEKEDSYLCQKLSRTHIVSVPSSPPCSLAGKDTDKSSVVARSVNSRHRPTHKCIMMFELNKKKLSTPVETAQIAYDCSREAYASCCLPRTTIDSVCKNTATPRDVTCLSALDSFAAEIVHQSRNVVFRQCAIGACVNRRRILHQVLRSYPQAHRYL